MLRVLPSDEDALLLPEVSPVQYHEALLEDILPPTQLAPPIVLDAPVAVIVGLDEIQLVPPPVSAAVASPLVTASLSSEPETTASLPTAELEFAKTWETEVSAEATPLTEKEKARHSTAKSSTKTVALTMVLKTLPLDEYPVKFFLIIPPL